MNIITEYALRLMAADKWKHLAAGIVVAVATMLFMVVQQLAWPAFYAAHPAFFAVLNAGLCVHLSKEATDRLNNRTLVKMGLLPMYGANWRDAAAGFAGTLALALLALWAGLV
ncbi:MAG: hypothetical protein Q8R98_12090 [Rubrivivax sp.]|nr:hypothetical protein [Rubrivivax sp.]MDP3612586.1 hypothetical protein [Rubrivivax sp.]